MLETILLFMLLPSMGKIMYLWYVAIFSLSISRLYDGYQYRGNLKKHSLEYWHKQFIIKAWGTAFLLGCLALFTIPNLSEYYQLFVFMILIGISGGAVVSLSSDHRMAIGYIMILLLPVAVEMLLLQTWNTVIIGLLLILYFITLTNMVFHGYDTNLLMDRKNEEIAKVQSELQTKQEMLALFFEQAPIGIFTYNTDLVITDCNQAFLDLFALQKEEIIGRSLSQLPDNSPVRPAKKALTEGPQTYVGPYMSIKGFNYWIEAKSAPLYSREKKVIGGLILIEDKTKEHNAIKELEYNAMHDSLTSLNNRRGFIDFMEKMVSMAEHQRYYSILFYMDLNQFKYINDSLGHSFGDKLLVAVAERLKQLVDAHNNLTRMGGDEFIIVAPFIDELPDKTKNRAEEYVKKIEKSFNEPFILDDVLLHVRTSIGVVIIEPGFNDIEEIVRHADVSMYQAKKHGHDFISYYNKALDEERKKVFNLQHELISALHDNALELYYQPIVKIKDDSLHAAEALIRWEHPVQGLVMPEDFIPVAIESGIIVEVGWWVLETVCRQIKEWKEVGRWKVNYISININAKQLLKNNFAQTFLDKLTEYGVNSSDIKIEITETSLIDNFEMTQDVIVELQQSGIRCVIDDFGTGYSSLSYLKKLSFSVLKIDREFMSGLVDDEESIALMRTMISIGKQLHYNVIIEGIENATQRDILREIDNTLSYQGYVISPPLPEEEFTEKFLV
ncbi:hypothetical protein YH65_05290 [Sulfurovum lithotrophicum]|uniref:Diguanylate cyclase n=2 Tax=Sulfurovum lithotrophicum TaxID=206403 RepID=A0A7U4M0Z2_9BACT|nr:hypothetical protein YH65_05290 [Sulfurovum lithotrophicum]